METFDVIKYLIKEIDLIIPEIENCNERLKNANEFCENHNQKMNYDVYKNFNLDEHLDKATVKQNAKNKKTFIEIRGGKFND